MRGLILSLFPGIDLLGRAFEAEGWCVVWGPDVIYARDIRGWTVPPGKFDGVIGGPPCQMFSRMRHIVEANGYKPKFGDLHPEFKRVVGEAQPSWWLCENVPEAPSVAVKGYTNERFMLSPRWLGGTQSRKRQFHFGWQPGPSRPGIAGRMPYTALESPERSLAALGCGRAVPVKFGGSGKPKPSADDSRRRSVAELAELQGFPGLTAEGWTVQGMRKALGNGVPRVMGQAIARAINEWLDEDQDRP